MFKTLLITENYIKSIVDSFLIDKEESYHLNKFMLSFNGSYVDFLHYTLYNYINYTKKGLPIPRYEPFKGTEIGISLPILNF